MRCNESRLAASSHLDRYLTLEESTRFRAHAAICADCRTYLADLGAEMADVSPGLRGRVMSSIAGESAVQSPFVCVNFDG